MERGIASIDAEIDKLVYELYGVTEERKIIEGTLSCPTRSAPERKLMTDPAFNVMLDTNIYDRIVETPGMASALDQLTAAGRIQILTTFIQQDEIAAIPDVVKRSKVKSVRTTKVTPTAGMYGVTPYGESPYGCDGSEGVLPVDALMSRSGKRWQDALIASTASAKADVLVTEDADLKSRVARAGIRCEVWGYECFRQYILLILTNS
jgi:predicted nucleic acid-binding protein